MFQLTTEEYSGLRSQIVTSSGKVGRRSLPYAFTEHGIYQAIASFAFVKTLYRFCICVSGPFSGENGAHTQSHEVLGTAKLPVFGYIYALQCSKERTSY